MAISGEAAFAKKKKRRMTKLVVGQWLPPTTATPAWAQRLFGEEGIRSLQLDDESCKPLLRIRLHSEMKTRAQVPDEFLLDALTYTTRVLSRGFPEQLGEASPTWRSFREHLVEVTKAAAAVAARDGSGRQITATPSFLKILDKMHELALRRKQERYRFDRER